MMPETGDGLDYLRIPFSKIKFGKKVEVQGYGSVFEGEFDDQRVALKQLNITNLANIKPKLLAEIVTISRFRQHPNLVALLGFCDDKSNEIILVYEYVGSGNLEDKMRKRLNTIQRFEICLGAARGLDYLHTGDGLHPGIVHGNIKLSKILLMMKADDANSSKFEAKVSSFGLSKIVPGKAYSDEVEQDKQPSKETDVHSFGVLLLQVLCGVSELVDTDDYQERHVTELVPKKMAQNKLHKIVHFDIRKEIKPEALETYAKIACHCLVENPEERPQMAQVVEQLQKALRLQGGEVTYIQIRGIRNIAGATNEPEDANTQELTSDDAGEVNNIIDAVSESTNGDKKNTTNTNTAHIEDAKNENSEDEPATEKEIINEEKESNITVENEEEDSSKTPVKEMSTIDQDTTEETIDDFDSDKKSNLIEKNKEDDESMQITTASESSNGGSTNQEVDESQILKSDRGNFNEVIEDGLEHLRIPFEKIKFGQKIDVHGYGTMFEGESNHQQVALKRLNITNLGNIKPKLLSAILTISRFRKHPNLVALIGFCDENNKEIILVYEYVTGGNLADMMSKHLTTIQRLQICLGAARGLEYLHGGDEPVDSNPGIIHGDLKLSKILLNSDSVSSNFEAKVSGFGLPKLLPGHVEIGPKFMDPVHAATGKLAKESDVYSFGVLLLEVLCGVPELVDTDDYQERHVTELVPKRLEQNMLRKIVHFDIRSEITSESLETYAKIACKCVMNNPEERPTMSEVVVELEKALRLQGGKASDVQISGSSNGNGLPEVPVGEDDHAGDDNGETISSDITEEESKVVETIDDINLIGESFPVPILDGNDVESVPEDADTKNGDNLNDPESTEEMTGDLKSIEESNVSLENEASNESKGENASAVQLLGSSNGNGLPEVSVGEDDQEGDDNGETISPTVTEEESKVTEETTDDTVLVDAEKESGDNMNVPDSIEEITVDLKSIEESMTNGENEVSNENKITTPSSSSAMQEPLPDERSDYENATKDRGNGLMMNTCNTHNKEITDSAILEDNAKTGSLNTEKPELIVNIRGDFSNSATRTQESESKRSNSTCSESSNGDDTTPSDLLLPKSPVNVTKTSKGSRSCCSCSWWQFISSRVVFYGGLFWNKLVSCFNWMTGQCSSKKD